MVQETVSEESPSQFVPLDLWRISFALKSLAITHSASTYADSGEPSRSIQGVGKGSSFAALSSTNFSRSHPEFDVSIQTIPQEVEPELEGDTDKVFSCGMIQIGYSEAIHDYDFHSPEYMRVNVYLSRDIFEALYNSLGTGRLGGLWFEGRPKNILVHKEQEFWEPEEQVLYLPSEAPKPDSFLDAHWPLNSIVWREAETMLMADPVKHDPEVEFANKQRDEERKEAIEQIKNIQKQVEASLFRMSEAVGIFHSVNLIGALILITLIYIAYRLS